MITTALRRTVLLTLLALGVGAALSWWRSQASAPTPAAPPQWPDWPDRPDRPSNAAPPVESAEQSWVPGNADGSAPATHPIKAKETSGIFHVPGGRFYDRTTPDRCYPTADAARADGYRQAKA